MSRTTRRTTGLVTFGGVLALLAGIGCSGSQPAKETSRPAAAAAEGQSIERCSPSPSPTIRARPRSTRAMPRRRRGSR